MYSCLQNIEKPKSPIFQVYPDRKILAGFKSLCKTPFFLKYLNPSIICLIIYIDLV